MSVHLSAIDGGYFRSFPYQERERRKIDQFDPSRGIHGFPEKLEDVLKEWRRRQP